MSIFTVALFLRTKDCKQYSFQVSTEIVLFLYCLGLFKVASEFLGLLQISVYVLLLLLLFIQVVMPPHMPVVCFGCSGSWDFVKSSLKIMWSQVWLSFPEIYLCFHQDAAILHHLTANPGIKRMWPVPFEGLHLGFIFTPRIQLFGVEGVIKASLLWRDLKSS